MNTTFLKELQPALATPAPFAHITAEARQAHGSGEMQTLSAQTKTGSGVLLRPLVAQDRESLRAAFLQLSLQSRLFRFFSPIANLSDEMLRYLTEVDQKRHVAWCALDSTSPQQAVLGTARFVRSAQNPGLAEFGFEVIDAYQRQGLGTLLFFQLYQLAQAAGVHTLRADLHPENYRALRFFQRWGLTGKYHQGLIALEFPVQPGGPPFTGF